MKKSVLFLIDALGCGGAEKSLVALLNRLDYSRLDVDLMVVRGGGMHERFVPAAVHRIPAPARRSRGRKLRDLLFSATLRLLRLLHVRRHGAEVHWKCLGPSFLPPEKEYDFAVAYQQGFPTYYVAEKVRAGKKLAWINMDLEPAGYRAGFNRPFYRRMDAICVVSDAIREKLTRTGFLDGDLPLHTVLDILDERMIREMAAEPVGDMPHSAPGLRLVSVGRMTPQKNYPLAVETARRLRDAGLDFIWYFIGTGSDYPRVSALVKDYGLSENIRMPGMRENPYPYMAGCDIYVQTSSAEGFCLTLSEAKILGKPVVSTDFPSALDQIRDGQNGLIARMTPESVAEKILLLERDPSLRRKIEQNVAMERNTTAETEIVKVNALLQ